MSLRYTGRPSPPCAKRLGREIDVHRAGQRIRDDERWRRQIVRAHVLLNAAFEVAIAAQHGRHHEAALAHLGCNFVGQRTAVADAGRATVTHGVEPEQIEVDVQTRSLQVIGHDFRAGCQARLHPRLSREALFNRALRQQARANHHAGIRCVGAAGDRGDDDRSVLQLRRRRDRRPARTMA